MCTLRHLVKRNGVRMFDMLGKQDGVCVWGRPSTKRQTGLIRGRKKERKRMREREKVHLTKYTDIYVGMCVKDRERETY